MQPDSKFVGLPLSLWADVRLIGEAVGYTDRKTRTIRVPQPQEVRTAYAARNLSAEHLFTAEGPTIEGRRVLSYLDHRARTLNEYVEPRLMDADRAKREFEDLRRRQDPNARYQ